MVRDEAILLVEDDPDDELLTRRTLKKNNVCNDVVVARDGAEALDYSSPGHALAGPRPGCLLKAGEKGKTPPTRTRVAERRRFGGGGIAPAVPSKLTTPSRMPSKGMVPATGVSRGLHRAAYGTTFTEEDSYRREFIPGKLLSYTAGMEFGVPIAHALHSRTFASRLSR